MKKDVLIVVVAYYLLELITIIFGGIDFSVVVRLGIAALLFYYLNEGAKWAKIVWIVLVILGILGSVIGMAGGAILGLAPVIWILALNAVVYIVMLVMIARMDTV